MSFEPLPPVARPVPANTLGVVGFVFSLLGYISCGLLSPIGLILSLFALRREPKGFAIAGTILGIIGSIGFIIALFFGSILLVTCGGLACLGQAVPHIATKIQIDVLTDDVKDYWHAHGQPPATLSEAAGAGTTGRNGRLTDLWNRPLRYHVSPDGTFTISSDGDDGVSGSGDDISRTEKGPASASSIP